MRYLLLLLPLLLYCSCSPKEEVRTNSGEDLFDSVPLDSVVLDSASSCSGSREVYQNPNRYEDASMFFEKMALQEKIIGDSFSFSFYDRDGIFIRELKYLGAVKVGQTEYHVIVEENRFGRYEFSLHGSARLTIYRDDVRSGSYYGSNYGELDFRLIDGGIEVSKKNKITKYFDTISFAEGIPEEVFIRDSMYEPDRFMGDFLYFWFDK